MVAPLAVGVARILMLTMPCSSTQPPRRQAHCHLEALNAVVVVQLWALNLIHKLFHLCCQQISPVSIFQAGRGRDDFIQACAREVWITCATWDITLVVGHIPGAQLATTADALSHWHLGQTFKNKVASLLTAKGLSSPLSNKPPLPLL